MTLVASWLVGAALVTSAQRLCSVQTVPPSVIKLADYQPYNLALNTTSLELWLDFEHTRVTTNMTVAEWTGGDVILNGSDLLTLEDVSIYYQMDSFLVKRNLTDSVCLQNATQSLVISEDDIPRPIPGAEIGEFMISVTNTMNPTANTHLFGLYRTRNMLVTQNESSGFRRITFYPDRPDVLSVFRVTMHADQAQFPVLLANGNLQSASVDRNGVATVVYYDPYPKPSYLFALAAGPLVKIEKVVTVGLSCVQNLNQLQVPPQLVRYCPKHNYQDVIVGELPTVAHRELASDSSFSFSPSSIGSTILQGALSLREYVDSASGYASEKVRGLLRDTFSSKRAMQEEEPKPQVRASPPVPDGRIGQAIGSSFCPLLAHDQNWSGVTTYDYQPIPPIQSCPWNVTLRVWAEKGTVELSQLEWSLESVHKAMLYDEVRFGRYYDLSEFNVVACRDFNAGAMENKGLNIFNEALIVADPDMTTDAEYERIRGVIAHEYFHNWSGDRVTVRDWFQLTLKEGFTVFRDQSFTEDLSTTMHTPVSSLMKRLRDIDLMETAQFNQDAGPMSHAIRPGEYQTVENFYTVTVYEKGAEVVRMYEVLLGPTLFRKATDEFFTQHMDSAATCEDFLHAVKTVAPQIPHAENATWDQFFHWYSTPGTPVIRVTNVHWSSYTETFTMTLAQSLPAAATVPALVIPLKVSLFDPDSKATFVNDRILVLHEPAHTFVFPDVPRRPVVSLLRNFSAPVILKSFQSDADLAFLVTNDDDAYVRYKAFDQLITNELRKCIIGGARVCGELSKTTFSTVDGIVKQLMITSGGDGFIAQVLALPKMSRLKTVIKPFRPQQLHDAVRGIQRQILKRFRTTLLSKYNALEEVELDNARLRAHVESLEKSTEAVSTPEGVRRPRVEGLHDPRGVSRRAVKNSLLRLLLTDPDDEVVSLALRQLEVANQATDETAALYALSAHAGEKPEVRKVLDHWLESHKSHALLVDRWFSAQMGWQSINCVERFEKLLQHAEYAESRTPNRLRALTRTFAANSVAFHQPRAYELVANEVLRWDKFNPKLAASLATSFADLGLVDEPLQEAGLETIKRVLAESTLSTNTREVLTNIARKVKPVS